MTLSLGRLNTVVFTGRVGERTAPVRQGVECRQVHLGAAVDHSVKGGRQPDADVSNESAAVRIPALRSREDLQLAAGVEQALRGRELVQDVE